MLGEATGNTHDEESGDDVDAELVVVTVAPMENVLLVAYTSLILLHIEEIEDHICTEFCLPT